MIILLTEIWEVVAALWNTGVRFARVAIRVVLGLIVVWPFVLLGISFVGSAGLTAGMALVPLVAVFILILVYPLVSGILAAFPQGRTFYLWLAVVLFGELILGLYLAAVPVWNWPELIPVLALSVVVLGMFLILKHQFGWRRGGWFAKALALTIVVITIIFFFGGDKKEARAEEVTAAVQAVPRVEEFTLNAGEEIDTVATGPGTQHRYFANSGWILVSAVPEGIPCPGRRPDGLCEFSMNARGSIIGTSAAGPARVRGVAPTMTIRFERADR